MARRPETPAGDRLRAALGIPWLGEFCHPTLVMGVVNVTPDSFQAEGRHRDTDAAVEHALCLMDQGADVLDIGGESTRPGAAAVSCDEEMARVIPVIEAIVARCSVPVSVDTRKVSVAEAALAAGARIVNDISAGLHDPQMLSLAARAGCHLILMHAPLEPNLMGWSTGHNPAYGDVMNDVASFLRERAAGALATGVDRERIWLDPGFGFAKSVDDNLTLLRRLDEIVALGFPVAIGTSRKSTLGRVLDDAAPDGRVDATLATVALAVNSGAAVVRVHDVAAAVRASRMADAILYGRFLED